MQNKQCANGRCVECPYSNYTGIPQPKAFEADVAIVAGSPERYELGTKQPIAGEGAEIIRRLIRGIGFPEGTRVYATTALLCKTPQKPKPKDMALAISVCSDRLFEELKIVQPKVIIALGNTAMHALSGDTKLKITAEQGRPLKSRYSQFENTTIIPTFHPGKILRDPSAYKQVHKAFKIVSDILNGRGLRDPGKSQYQLADTPEKARIAIDFLKKKSMVSADIEAGGLDALEADIICLGIGYAKNKSVIFAEPVLSMTKELLEDTNIKFTWHNGKFDSSFFATWGILANVDHDLMLLHYALNESGYHDLETVAYEVAGFEPWEHKIKGHLESSEDSYRKIPLPVLYEYLAVDVDATLQCTEELLAKVEADPNLKKLYYNLLLPASRFLQKVERKGIYVNLEAVSELEKEMDAELEKAESTIYEIAETYWDPLEYMRATGAKQEPEAFNPRSPKQFSWLLYDSIGIPINKQFGRSTSKQAIEALESSGIDHPICTAITELRSLKRTKTEYVTKIREGVDSASRIHTSYLLHRTSTGRLASIGPNMQNVPAKKRIRNIFQAPPGYQLVEADYSQAELRVLAFLSGDTWLKRVFQEGRDLHEEVRQDIFGPMPADPEWAKEQRMRAKTLNFGIPYGREAYSISVAFGISVREAQDMIDAWFARMPDAARFLENSARAARTGTPMVTRFGRYKRFGLVTQQNVEGLENEARNFPMQSTASDLTLLSGITMQSELESFGASVVNLVHDSILTESLGDPVSLYRTATILVNTMTSVPEWSINSDVPFEVDFKVGTQWGELEEISLKELAERAGVEV